MTEHRNSTSAKSPALAGRAVGGWRRLLVHASLVVLAIVLLKWLCLEVFFIPSPSMQPLLLGSQQAAVHDRVLVDKLHYLLAEPQRWDLTVFRSPLQRRQAVVKRCVGLPGERLRIAGGNVYARDESHTEGWRVRRKPDAVQQHAWREVYPFRRLLRGQDTALGGGIVAEPASGWHESPDGTLHTRGGSGDDRVLVFDDEDGGLVDRIWDGHPPAVARVLREASSQWGLLAEIVPDARVAVEVETAAPPSALELALTIHRPGHLPLRFALEVRLDSGRLVVREGDAALEVSGSDPFPCPVSGSRVRLAFAHVDDELIAWRDGEIIHRVDVSPWQCREGCELPSPRGFERARPTADQRVELSIRYRSDAPAALRDLAIWRDQHYTRGALPADHVIEVPDGHFFMLGDNPQQSEDSRGLPTIEIGRAAGDRLVPPTAPGATRHRGALRLGDSERPPADEENPILLPDLGLALLLDELGEPRRLALDGPASWHFGTLQFGEGAAAWEPPTFETRFVARELLTGRVIARIWPLPPLGPWRPGWVR